MAVTEARRAAENIFRIQIEIAGFAAVAALAFNVSLAGATAGIRLATWLAVQAAGDAAATRPATLRTKIEKVVFATVALVAGHTRFARTFAFTITLQAS